MAGNNKETNLKTMAIAEEIQEIQKIGKWHPNI